jgi:hypothetical protein
MIDDFWISLKQAQKFVNSSDAGYNLGRGERVGDRAVIDASVTDIARRLAGLNTETIKVAFALGDPWEDR